MTNPTDPITLTREIVEDLAQCLYSDTNHASRERVVKNLLALLTEPRPESSELDRLPSIESEKFRIGNEIRTEVMRETVGSLYRSTEPPPPRDADGAADALLRHCITPETRWRSDGNVWFAGEYRVSENAVQYKRSNRWVNCTGLDINTFLAAEQRGELVRVGTPVCINCGKPGSHFVPPSLGEEGFFHCNPQPQKGGATSEGQPNAHATTHSHNTVLAPSTHADTSPPLATAGGGGLRQKRLADIARKVDNAYRNAARASDVASDYERGLTNGGLLLAEDCRELLAEITQLREAVRVLADAIRCVPELTTEAIETNPIASAAVREAKEQP